jgi:UDP-N-acetyl-D-mannosaminuronic acid dehydrogenase
MEKVVVVGGCGHVGLPLAIALASKNYRVVSYDIDKEKVNIVNSGVMPFMEDGASDLLRGTLKASTFFATADKNVIGNASFVVIVIGTPVDEHLNPDPEAIIKSLIDIKSHLNSSQILILRSTIFPGVTARVEKWCSENIPGIEVAFCPERIAEGKAMVELFALPQIVGARTEKIGNRASSLFRSLTDSIILTTPEEAELAKLFTNVWRYLKFAAVNQFFMMANDFGVDFEKVRQALTQDYPRASDMPSAGFSAGPCLFKDTMQLGAFSNNSFSLGHSAMLINEGMPLYIVDKIKSKYDLENLRVGILGMAFKADIDDIRSSLSYKLKRILQFQAKEVYCTDSYVIDNTFKTLDYVIENSDLIIIGAPHSTYLNLKFDVPVIDIWNLSGNGVLL